MAQQLGYVRAARPKVRVRRIDTDAAKDLLRSWADDSAMDVTVQMKVSARPRPPSISPSEEKSHCTQALFVGL